MGDNINESEVAHETPLRQHVKREQRNRRIRTAGWVTIGALLSFATGSLLFGDLNADILGDFAHKRSPEAMQKIADQEAHTRFINASAAGRYAMLLLHTDADGSINFIDVNSLEDGSGLARFVGDVFLADDQEYTPGQDCLAKTPFNTTYGPNKAVLTVEDDTIAVYAMGSSAKPIKFTQADDNFKPSDSYTRQTLEAYGCDTAHLTM